jgi:ATP-dependent RNA helicase DDX42
MVVQVNAMRRQLDVHVAGFGAPRPVKTFRQCGFDARLMGAISKQG